MKTATEALEVARSYLGTPYVLGGRRKGAGVDCATLLGEYLIEIGRTTEAALIEAGFYRECGAGHSYSHDWFLHTTRQDYLRGIMMFGKLVYCAVPVRQQRAVQPWRDRDLLAARDPRRRRQGPGDQSGGAPADRLSADGPFRPVR